MKIEISLSGFWSILKVFKNWSLKVILHHQMIFNKKYRPSWIWYDGVDLYEWHNQNTNEHWTPMHLYRQSCNGVLLDPDINGVILQIKEMSGWKSVHMQDTIWRIHRDGFGPLQASNKTYTGVKRREHVQTGYVFWVKRQMAVKRGLFFLIISCKNNIPYILYSGLPCHNITH